MSKASDKVIINVTPEEFWEVLVDYERYPEFQKAVKAVNILKRNAKSTDIEMEVEFIKVVRYSLRMKEDKNKKLSWSLLDGSLFKLNSGSWELTPTEKGTKTAAVYSIELEFGLFVPKMITTKLVDTALPSNLKAFKKRAETLHSSKLQS